MATASTVSWISESAAGQPDQHTLTHTELTVATASTVSWLSESRQPLARAGHATSLPGTDKGTDQGCHGCDTSA